MPTGCSTDGKVGHLKDLLINCGYPLIERFPLMLGTAGAVLLIGLVRWYFGMSHRTTVGGQHTPPTRLPPTAPTQSPLSAASCAKLNSLLGIASDEDDADETPPPTQSGPARATLESGPEDRPSLAQRSFRHPFRPEPAPGMPGQRWKTRTTPW